MPPWQFMQAVQGVNAANVAVATAKLTKTGGSQLVDDAGASTVQTISGDGFAEMVAVETITFRSFGLSDTDSATTLADIVFGWYLKQDGTLEVRENGSVVASFASYAAGDIFRVERIGSTIRYYQDGVLKHTSASTSAGPLRIDTTLLNITGTPSTLDAIRLYDGTLKAWLALTWQNVTNCTVTTGAAHSDRRITFTTPSTLKAGDQLVFVIGSQGHEFVKATNVAHDFVNSFASVTNQREVNVYRHIVTSAAEPATYTFDLAVTQTAVGVLLVYRGLDNTAAWLGGSGVETSSTTSHPCPSRTLTRFADLYVGVIVQSPGVGGMSAPPDGAGRVDASTFITGLPSTRMFVFDFAAEAVGATDAKRASDLAASSSSALSFALQGLPARSLSLSPAAQVAGLSAVGA